MTHVEIDQLLDARLSEAAKLMKMSDTHSELHRSLQTTLRNRHRAENPNSDYYSYPYVSDVQGDHESGLVVYSKDGKYHQSKYTRKGDSHEIGDPNEVQVAYIPKKEKSEEAKESLSDKDGHLIDGDMVELVESAFDAEGNGEIKLISPGLGSSGYYSPDVLKKAAEKKVFGKGTQMFLDHQTESDERQRPEGSLTNLAAVLTSDAEYKNHPKLGEGLYAKAKAYSSHREFLNERAKDIGVSIRAAGKANKGKVGGVDTKIVEELVIGKSVDFVTRAGCGGMIALYESYRGNRTERPVNADNKEGVGSMNEEELKKLREAAARVEALEAENASLRARTEATNIVTIKVQESSLPKAAHKRIVDHVLATIPMKEGKLDSTTLESNIKTAIDAEVVYLKEAGVPVGGTSRISGLGDTKPQDKKEVADLAEARKSFDESISALSGIKKGDK